MNDGRKRPGGGRGVARQTLWSAAATGANAVYFFALIPIITKLGGLDSYGLWEGTTVLVALMAPVAWMGLRSGFTRYNAGAVERRELSANFHAVLLAVVAAAILLGGLELALSPVLASRVFAGQPQAGGTLRLAAILLAVEAVHLVVLEYYRATMRIRAYAAILVSQRGLELAAVTGLLMGGYSITACVAATLVVRGAALLAGYAGVVATAGIVRPDFTRLWPYMVFGFPLLLNEFLGRVLKAADRLLIGYYWDADAVGAYAVPFNMGMVFLLYTSTLQVWLYPHLSSLWNRGKQEQAVAMLAQVLRFFVLLGLPTVVGMASVGPALVTLVSSPEVALKTALVVPILQTGLFLYGMASLTLYALTLAERTAAITWVLLCAVGVNLGLNVLLIPLLGIVGGALASLTGFLFLAVLMTVVARRAIPVRVVPDGWQIPRVLLACLAMAIVVALIGPDGPIRLAAAVTAGAAVYGGTLLATRCVTLAEIRALRGGPKRRPSTDEGGSR